MEQENLSPRHGRPVALGAVGTVVVEREKPRGQGQRGESTDVRHRGGPARSSDEGPVMGLEPRGRAGQVIDQSTLRGRN